ncbi:arabinose 5-phosphate isomerase [Acinetobacter phage Minot]|nr:arabinose 5-phosphate isomerase [Acinetobacter phage Minot]QQO96529.1 arabinose 5-phosphate isomerase [Acinetobacter phage Mokit]
MDNIDLALKVVEDQNDALDYLHTAIAVNGDKYSNMIDILKVVAASNYRQRIVITGVGKNSNLATKASETFASLGIPSMYLNTCHYSHGDAGFIGHDDIVIHVSRSGKTEEMQYMARHLKTIRPNVLQILLHCNSQLTEEQKAPFDIEFGIPGIVECDDNHLAPTTSTTVLLVLLDTIGVILSKHLRFTREDFYSYHPGGSLGAMLKSESK